MAVESTTNIAGLNAASPSGSLDQKAEGDDQLRLLKTVLQATWPGLDGRDGRCKTKSLSAALTATDNGTVQLCTTTVTLTPDSAATLGNGWHCWIDPQAGNTAVSSGNLVNGSASIVLLQGTPAFLFCTGTTFRLLRLHEGTTSNTVVTTTGTQTLSNKTLAAHSVTGDSSLTSGARHLYQASGGTWVVGTQGGANYQVTFSGNSYDWLVDPSGNMYTRGNVIAFYSDERLKDNVKLLEGGLEAICELIRPVRFTWNSHPLADHPGEDSIGVIAQDVQRIYPEAVQEIADPKGQVDDKMLWVDYQKLVPVLISAIRELAEKVEGLRKQVNDLTS